ncbi:MAG: hypothetical protein KKC68_01070 [Candidatus Thermoplasmatota archaeon]|nr:hypothetical protein [Candidatus Thermoplasmatota archaeon]MBU1940341.1 hypothetical protein [Candidatus Thermoplasmatota archaeon]
MERSKLIATILVFGSLWGLAECIIGGFLRDVNLPAGAIMTGFFAVGLLSLSRIMFNIRGMQLGMGLVAGTLRLVNPIGGCFICSAIAIMAEGLLFELIYTTLYSDKNQIKNLTQLTSFGIVSAYSLYVGGYIITQILTPLFSSAGFYLTNLLVFIPQILASGLLAGLLGAATIPLICKSITLNIHIADRQYLPTTLTISLICWVLVIANTLFIIGV